MKVGTSIQWRAMRSGICLLVGFAVHFPQLPVIDFPISPYNRATFLAGEIWGGDGGLEYKSIMEPISEPLIPGVLGSDASDLRNAYEMNNLNREKQALQQKFLEDWRATASKTSTGREIDGLLAAPAPFPACLPQMNKWVGYTTTFNVMDVPGVVFPVTKVDAEKDGGKIEEKAYGSLDEEYISGCEFNHSLEYRLDGASLPVPLRVLTVHPR